MTWPFVIALIAAVFGLPYLWREHRLDFWLALALFAGKRAGRLADMEDERRRAALVGEPLIDEIAARWS